MSTTNLLTINNHSLTGESPYLLNRDGSIMAPRAIMGRHDQEALLQRFPNLRIIDAAYWESRGITVQNEPPIDNYEVVPVLKTLYRNSVALEITILTIPKGLTRAKVVQSDQIMSLNSDDVKNNGQVIIDGFFMDDIVDPPSQKTYRIIIANQPIESDQINYLRMPRIIEAVALMHLDTTPINSATDCCENVRLMPDSSLAEKVVYVSKEKDSSIEITEAVFDLDGNNSWPVYECK
jgi:hypothetical protein